MVHGGLAKLVRFGAVGALGFLVDAGVLALLISLGSGPFLARIISIALAMFVTWRLNRSLTFGASEDGQAREAGRYFGVAIAVALLNYAIYSGLLLTFPACPPVLATAISTAICTAVSFLGYGKYAFRPGKG
ncbi:MAG: GtrA family protein [Henriciella sp.]|uniref:GtrA family protein n=1 Tax=Henriciella sp. TaxID=1968823 RepID=UPI003C7827CB